MKVIFLDIDGVLNTTTSHQSFEPKAIQELNRILTYTGAKIVISSGWREKRSLAQLIARLESEGVLAGRVIDVTPIDSHRTRGYEIEMWLKAHQKTHRVTDFVALEDELALWPLPEESMVYLDAEKGLTTSAADWVIERLSRKA